MNSNSNNTLIETTNGDNKTIPDNPNNVNKPGGTGSTIRLSKNIADVFDLTGNNIGGSPDVNLAHQLAHARDNAYGINDRSTYMKYTFSYGQTFEFKISEIRAVYIENKIRKDMKLPLRGLYGFEYNDPTMQVASPPLLSNPKTPILLFPPTIHYSTQYDLTTYKFYTPF